MWGQWGVRLVDWTPGGGDFAEPECAARLPGSERDSRLPNAFQED
jgi:hypothetical protein